MAIRTQIRLEQLTGSLNDTGGAVAALSADSLQGVQDALASAIKRITGAGSFHAQNAGEFSQAITPVANSGQDLGSAAKGWDDMFLGDDGVIQLGNDQDTTLTHVPDVGVLLNSVRQLQFGDSGTEIHQESDGNLQATADGSFKVVAPISELEASTAVVIDSPQLNLEDDGAILAFGAGRPTQLIHIAANDSLRLNDAIKLEFRDATEFVHSDADGFMHMEGETGVHLAVNGVDELAVTSLFSTFGGDIRIPDAGYVGNASVAQAIQLEADGDVNIVKDLVMRTNGSSIVNAGVDVVTFNATEVKIPGDLTVLGTTTTIDSTNLEVEDALIGLNYTSGSISGGARDAGLIMGQTGGDAPVAKAFYYDTGDSRFKIVETATAASGTNITDGAYQDLQLGDLYLEGLDIYGDGSGKAVVLTTGNSPDVGVQNNLTMGDDKSIVFGAGSDAQIKYDEAASDRLQILAAGAGALLSVSAGDIVLGHSGLGAAALGDVLKIQKIGTDGVVQVSGSIHSFGNDLILSSSGGKELKHMAGTTMMFLDGFKPATWSDADGIKLASAAASWTNFEAAYGEASILDAIVSAGGGAGTIQKRTVEVTGSAGYPIGYSVPLNMDLDQLGTADADERVDVYVNGQLMASSSEVTGNGDYALVGPVDSSTPVVFQFNLSLDDVVTAVVR